MRGWTRYQQLAQKNRKDLTKDEFKEMSKIKGLINRRGMNSPIQGTAGDMTKDCLNPYKKEINRKQYITF